MSSLKRRTASVVIYQGDDLAKLGHLKREADVAERRAQQVFDDKLEQMTSGTARIGDDLDEGAIRQEFEDAVRPSRDAFDAGVDAAADRAVTVTLEAIGRRRFRPLRQQHPPRTEKVTTVVDGVETITEKTVDEDVIHGINVETFPEALLTFSDGEFRTIAWENGATALADFLDNDVSDGDFDRLWLTAWALNTAEGADPKAFRFSTPTRTSSDS